MPKDKDLKRLARARMEKTGESYTAARSQLLRKKEAPRESEDELAAKAGMASDAVRAKTGRGWRQWVDALDAIDAAKMTHTEIARHLNREMGVPGWWSQAVTVGYERIRGLREVGQRRGGLYEAGKSRTFPVTVDALYRAFANARTRARWLPGVKIKIRTAIANKSMRVTWPDGTDLLLGFTAKGTGKAALALVHSKLPSRAAIAESKAYWAERLAALSEIL
jgi:uncharacterized protein YndB with AHSA1/START domain